VSPYNVTKKPSGAENPGLSAFALDDGVIYHANSTRARGLDAFNAATALRNWSTKTAGAQPARRRGHWHIRQIESIVSDGIRVLVPPDAGLRVGASPGWDKGPDAFMRRVLASDAGHEL
jgi:hypothetical protein